MTFPVVVVAELFFVASGAGGSGDVVGAILGEPSLLAGEVPVEDGVCSKDSWPSKINAIFFCNPAFFMAYTRFVRARSACNSTLAGSVKLSIDGSCSTVLPVLISRARAVYSNAPVLCLS